MPIRMEEDESSSRPQKSFRRNPSSGGGNFAGGNILLTLLPFLIRRPKLLLVLAVIGIGLYFFMGPETSSNIASNVMSSFNKGATLDQTVFDEAEVFEPLSPEGNTLPERVSLEAFCPKRMNQGQQGSCVGWGSAYAARTILQASATGKNPNDIAFSPAFLYNQIKLEGCQGSYINRAMESMTQVGSLPFTNFAYTDESCDRTPTDGEVQQAASYKMKGSNRLTKNGDDYTIDLLAIKQNLAQGAPVVIGMMVGGTFMQPMMGQKCWIPTDKDYQMSGFGGHCMCVIGYDDYLEGGAFQIMNSWGGEWGENGIAWVRYNDFAYFTKEAYGVYPMRNVVEQEKPFSLQIGLLLNESKKLVPLQEKSSQVVESAVKLKAGDKFKIQVYNETPCYTYVFGRELTGETYVLFPYTPKHSPYCGITGTRVFPKDFSMKIDDQGNRDEMLVVVTRQPIDYNSFKDKLNNIQGTSYANKVESLLAEELAPVTTQVTQGQIILKGSESYKNATYVVVEISK